MGLKKNINVPITLFFNFLEDNIFCSINRNSWRKYCYLFKNSYFPLKFTSSAFLTSLDCLNFSLNSNNSFLRYSDGLFNILDNHKFNQSLSFDGVDKSISHYHAFWNTFGQFSLFNLLSHMPQTYFLVGHQMLSSSFFIHSFDSYRFVYPNLYFRWKYFSGRFYNIFDIKFIKNNTFIFGNVSFFINLLNLFCVFYRKKFYSEYALNFIDNFRNKYFLFFKFYFFLFLLSSLKIGFTFLKFNLLKFSFFKSFLF